MNTEEAYKELQKSYEKMQHIADEWKHLYEEKARQYEAIVAVLKEYNPPPITIPTPSPHSPAPHYHQDGVPCYKNPCVWC